MRKDLMRTYTVVACRTLLCTALAAGCDGAHAIAPGITDSGTIALPIDGSADGAPATCPGAPAVDRSAELFGKGAAWRDIFQHSPNGVLLSVDEVDSSVVTNPGSFQGWPVARVDGTFVTDAGVATGGLSLLGYANAKLRVAKDDRLRFSSILAEYRSPEGELAFETLTVLRDADGRLLVAIARAMIPPASPTDARFWPSELAKEIEATVVPGDCALAGDMHAHVPASLRVRLDGATGEVPFEATLTVGDYVVTNDQSYAAVTPGEGGPIEPEWSISFVIVRRAFLGL